MNKLFLGTGGKRSTTNKRKRGPKDRPTIQEEAKTLVTAAKRMANEVAEKLTGKVRVPHPTIPKAWIYVDA